MAPQAVLLFFVCCLLVCLLSTSTACAIRMSNKNKKRSLVNLKNQNNSATNPQNSEAPSTSVDPITPANAHTIQSVQGHTSKTAKNTHKRKFIPKTF